MMVCIMKEIFKSLPMVIAAVKIKYIICYLGLLSDAVGTSSCVYLFREAHQFCNYCSMLKYRLHSKVCKWCIERELFNILCTAKLLADTLVDLLFFVQCRKYVEVKLDYQKYSDEMLVVVES